jgi:hypothetical protein
VRPEHKLEVGAHKGAEHRHKSGAKVVLHFEIGELKQFGFTELRLHFRQKIYLPFRQRRLQLNAISN